MAIKPMKRSLSLSSVDSDSNCLGICDVLLVLLLLSITCFVCVDVYRQKNIEETKLQEESILCIKDFDASNCNPFNMTEACSRKMECIKRGDGIGIWDLLSILNKHIKGNGAIPIFMVFLALGN